MPSLRIPLTHDTPCKSALRKSRSVVCCRNEDRPAGAHGTSSLCLFGFYSYFKKFGNLPNWRIDELPKFPNPRFFGQHMEVRSIFGQGLLAKWKFFDELWVTIKWKMPTQQRRRSWLHRCSDKLGLGRGWFRTKMGGGFGENFGIKHSIRRLMHLMSH